MCACVCERARECVYEEKREEVCGVRERERESVCV